MPLFFLFIVFPLSFYFGGFWVGLIVFFVVAVFLGWGKRHDGPFGKIDK